MSRIFFVKFNFFYSPVTHFLKYFHATHKFHEIQMSGSRQIGVFLRKIVPYSIAIF